MTLNFNKIYNMDCIEGMKKIKDNSVDSIVTDPPYLLNFMSKKWDKADCIDPSFGHWFAGFTDGEGCFRIHKEKRGKYYACNFQIKLRRDDRKILEYIREQTGVGKVSDLKPYGNSKPCSLYFVGRRDDCIRIADIFLQFPLKAKKKRDFIKWYECLQNWIYRERGDNTLMEQNWREMKKIRKYRESPVPLNKDSYWHYIWGKEALRILKPGGYLLAFSGTRTYHRMVCGIEDAGFEIRDTISWMYGSGFPKSLNIGKAVDKLQGNEREELGDMKPAGFKTAASGYTDTKAWSGKVTKGTSEWEGFGTAIKPAHEPICMARKPLAEKTIAENCLKWGTGGINIDECRIDLKGEKNPTGSAKRVYKNNQYTEEKNYGDNKVTPDKGRFPANVILDEESSKMLDEQSGKLTSGLLKAGHPYGLGDGQNVYGKLTGKTQSDTHGDSGGASRFFKTIQRAKMYDKDIRCSLCKRKLVQNVEKHLNQTEGNKNTVQKDVVEKQQPNQILCDTCVEAVILNSIDTKKGVGEKDCQNRFMYTSKAHGSERNAGLHNKMETKEVVRQGLAGEHKNPTYENDIVSLKPINLMRYLIRLVTPPKGIVLDPFAGSGTTGCACVIEGFKYILFEKRERFAKEIIPRRIAYWKKPSNWKQLNDRQENKDLPPTGAKLDKWL